MAKFVLQEEALDVLYMSNVIVIKYIVIHNLSSLTSVRIFGVILACS